MKRRKRAGSVLVEAMAGFFLFIPLALFAADLLVLFHSAQMNEEFAEQLARLCATLPNKTNAVRACSEVIRQYKRPHQVTELELTKLEFDVARLQVTLSTTMVVQLPIPFPGFSQQVLAASVTQPIVSQASAQ